MQCSFSKLMEKKKEITIMGYIGIGFRGQGWGSIGLMEKKMETTIMENQMERTWKMKWKLGYIWKLL